MAQYRRIWIALVSACGFAASHPAQAQGSGQPRAQDPAWALCSKTALKVEAELGMPAYLLKAVSLTETGRSGPDRRVSTWPWTVHDGSQGHHFATKEDAVAFVRDIRSDGRRSIDVGCMQVNLRHHPRAFTSVAAGFDPEVNIRYAAEFLKQLYNIAGSWEQAVARYHSHTPGFDAYAGKVITYWRIEQQLAALQAPAKRVAQADHSAGQPTLLVLASATPDLRRRLAAPAVVGRGKPSAEDAVSGLTIHRGN